MGFLFLGLTGFLLGILLVGYLFFLLISNFFGAPFVPVSPLRLKKAVELAGIKPGMKVVDLGSGDGRAAVIFAQKEAQVTGFEINPFLVLWSGLRIKKKGLGKRVSIFWRNFWEENLSEFDLVFVYGIDRMMGKLGLKLKKELRPGTKVISVGFPLPGWQIKKTAKRVFLYQVA